MAFRRRHSHSREGAHARLLTAMVSLAIKTSDLESVIASLLPPSYPGHLPALGDEHVTEIHFLLLGFLSFLLRFPFFPSLFLSLLSGF